jgi:hypothetical protein
MLSLVSRILSGDINFTTDAEFNLPFVPPVADAPPVPASPVGTPPQV